MHVAGCMIKYTLAFLSAIATHTLQAQQDLPPKIDSLVRHQQRVSEIPGYTAAVILNNKVIYQKAYGVQSLQTGAALTTRSDFHMASVSKPVAATAILQLAEKGKLRLDDLLIRHLPAFTMKDERYRQITLYHILTHSSGIPDVHDYQWHAPQNDDSAAARYTKSFADAQLDFTPGENFRYSNAAYNILSDVVAKLSGLSFEAYVTKNIFTPAGMANSSFLFDAIVAARRTAPHIINKQVAQSVSEVYPYNRIHAPSSTLHSNLEDMTRWANVFLQKGSAGGKPVISAATRQSMTQPRRTVYDNISVCLSWFETTIAGKKVYFHSGGDLGYRSFVGFSPETGAAVALIGNNDLFDGASNGFAIFNALFSPAPLQLTPQPVAFALKAYILQEGIQKTRLVYDSLKKAAPQQYDCSAAAVAPLAEWLYDRDHKQPAIDILIFCTELDPKDFHWYEYIGDVYNAWGKKSEAIEWYRKALQVAPAEKGLQEKLEKLRN